MKKWKKSFERHRQIVLVLFSPHSMFFLAHSLSLLLSYFFFQLLSCSFHKYPCSWLHFPSLPAAMLFACHKEKRKKMFVDFFFAFFSSRFSRCKQVFLCATRLNFVCHFFFAFPFLLVSFRFCPSFFVTILCVFYCFFSSSLFTFWCGEIIVLNGDWLSPRTTPARARARTAGQVEQLEEEKERSKGSGSPLVSAYAGPTKQFKSWFCFIFKDFRS